MKTLIRILGSSVLVFVLVFMPLGRAHAQLTQADLNEQAVVVQERVVDFLQEYVKFLQVNLILNLQQRVATLQALIQNR